MVFAIEKTPLERFTERYETNSDGCWIWIGSSRRDPMGYGQFAIGKKNYSAHRVAYLLFRGDIPAGMCVCHRCDRPLCVNPDHLFLGTHQENATDRDRKGRYRNGRTKLTAEQIKEIIESQEPSPPIAKRMGVTRGRVEQIRRAAGQRRVHHY